MDAGHEGFNYWRFAQFVHGHIERTISQFDLKITILAGFAGAAMTVLIGDSKLDLGSPPVAALAAQFAGGAPSREAVASLLQYGALGAFALALASGVWCIRPRRSRKVGDSNVYFQSIARLDAASYVAGVLAKEEGEIVASLLTDVHALARISRRKEVWAGYATNFVILGVALWAAALALAQMGRG